MERTVEIPYATLGFPDTVNGMMQTASGLFLWRK